MEFSDEQQDVFNKYIDGKNVFITGPGGTGKSEIIREIYKHATTRNKKICVTALTGCAAVLLQCCAKTLHSYAGIGNSVGTTEEIIKKIATNKYKKKNWLETDILIVDEVSMLSLKIFDLLNKIGQRVRKCPTKPFGGIQVIFSGDFFQLPPVGDPYDPDTCKFCFESEDWDTVFPRENQIKLEKIFRQQDPIYATILNQIREGILKRSGYEILLKYVGRPLPDSTNGIIPTKLFPTRSKVDYVNNMEMEKLYSVENVYALNKIYNIKSDQSRPSPIKTKNQYFTASDIERELDYLAKNVPCDPEIRLKIGAQVMCVVNMPDINMSLCNGSQGIVTGFNSVGTPLIKFHGFAEEIPITPHTWQSETIPNVGVSQLPLILSWALTIHKAQGKTLDFAEIDVGNNVFECGQTYVALSRVKSLEGLYLTSFNYQKILTNKKVKQRWGKTQTPTLTSTPTPTPTPTPT
jgi:ATP-dependent DNA helicase PIF1